MGGCCDWCGGAFAERHTAPDMERLTRRADELNDEGRGAAAALYLRVAAV
jgi:hypothetical protein